MTFDYSQDFPINENLIYLNNASYGPIPKTVVENMSDFLMNEYSAFGPDSDLSNLKEIVDEARIIVSDFINCSPEEVIFTQSITHGINIIAEGYKFYANDTILLREASKDHVANFLPWLKRSKSNGINLEILGSDIDGGFSISKIKEYMSKHPGGLITLPHASYNYGTIIDVSGIATIAHKYNYSVFIDAGQTIGCQTVDVKKLNCDFLAFSGYKWLCSTPGIGVLYIRKTLQKKIKYCGLDVRSLASRKEGERIFLDFTDNEYTMVNGPQKFEAGFRNYTGIIGLIQSIKYLKKIGINYVQKKNNSLLKTAIEGLSEIKNLKIYGPNDVHKRTSLISFSVKNLSVSNLVSYLFEKKTILAAREIGQLGVVRISPHYYNNKNQIIAVISQIKRYLNNEQ